MRFMKVYEAIITEKIHITRYFIINVATFISGLNINNESVIQCAKLHVIMILSMFGTPLNFLNQIQTELKWNLIYNELLVKNVM